MLRVSIEMRRAMRIWVQMQEGMGCMDEANVCLPCTMTMTCQITIGKREAGDGARSMFS
jgi:hypothetical protein